MDSRLQHGFRVGEYEVRPLEGSITGPAGSQHLQPKVMEVLLCLAEYPGELVERSTLIERGWGDTVESDEVLTRCISELRHHFDDHRDKVRYIQTVPRRGYRLVADVTPAGSTTEPATVSAGQPAGLAALWADLQQRNVVRVSIAYIIVAWLVLQVGETIFNALLLPEWLLTALFAFLVLGFPVVVVLAWIFQVTPEGVVVDVAGARDKPIALRRNLDIVIIGALTILVAILGFRLVDAPNSTITVNEDLPIARATPVSSIAVLKFLNIGGEPHFADGLGEELLDRLAQLKELGVAARTSSWAYAGSSVGVPTIAEELEVDYVLEGSVRQSGNQIRVTAQLNDGRTGKHVWSQTYERELTARTFFQTQSEIAMRVASLLELSLTPEAETRLAAAPETSMQALDFYLQGQEAFRKPHSDQTLDEAARLFRRSLEIDPRFAMAYAGLCDTELGRYIMSRDTTYFEEAERACHRALTLDSDMPRVRAALGGLYLFSGQYEKSREELVLAINANPNLIDAYADLGEALEYLGETAQAEATFKAMIERQPGYWYAHNAYGTFLYRQSRYEEAARAYEKVTEIRPDRAVGFNNQAIAYYMSGDFAAASESYEKSIALEPYVETYSNLGLAYFYDGQYEQAAAMQRRALELGPDDARVMGRLATVYDVLGRADEAAELYNRALQSIERQLVVNPSDARLNRFYAVYNVSIGNIDEGRRVIAAVVESQPESSGGWYDAAKVELAAGDPGKAVDYLERARELGYSAHIISSDPFFAALRDDSRFREISKQED